MCIRDRVMFCDDYGISGICYAVQEFQEVFDVDWMQAGCGLIHEIQAFFA